MSLGAVLRAAPACVFVFFYFFLVDNICARAVRGRVPFSFPLSDTLALFARLFLHAQVRYGRPLFPPSPQLYAHKGMRRPHKSKELTGAEVK